MNTKINHTAGLTTLFTGHGKLNSYFTRFKIKENLKCICGAEDQTTDHIIYDCIELQTARNVMVQDLRDNKEEWPTNKSELVSRNMQTFTKFVNSIYFEYLSNVP